MVYMDSAKQRAALSKAGFTVPAFSPEDYDPKALKSLYGLCQALQELDRGLPPAQSRGFLRAWDPVHQRLAWEVSTASDWDGGVLSDGRRARLPGQCGRATSTFMRLTMAIVLRTYSSEAGVLAAPNDLSSGGVSIRRTASQALAATRVN